MVAYHLRSTIIHSNKLVVITKVINSGQINSLPQSRLSIRGATFYSQPTDIHKASIIYNPVTHGYVIAAELSNYRSKEIIAAYLDINGKTQSGGAVFSFSVDVKQPNVMYDSLTQTLVFVSQLDSSYPGTTNGKNSLIMRTEPASFKSTGSRSATMVASTAVEKSSISMHTVGSTNCIRVCYLVKDKDDMTVPTCSKVCTVGYNRWDIKQSDVSFSTCKQDAANLIVIHYPISGTQFGVWEEMDATRHRLHGYYVSTQNFVQSPHADVQRKPIAVYKEIDGQVCVAWQYGGRAKKWGKLAFRCFKMSPVCNDPCSCLQSNIPHCGKISKLPVF